MSRACPFSLYDQYRSVYLAEKGRPLARRIGERLHQLGGMLYMQQAAEVVFHEGFKLDVAELNAAWRGIGEWCS